MQLASAQTKGDGGQRAPGEIAGLIAKARNYDRAAFTSLYHLTVTSIYRYFSVRLASQDEAEELTQEVFMAAFSGIRGLRAEDETGLLAWLFQIARHKLADYLRQRYRRPTVPLVEMENIETHQPRPDEVAEVNEEQDELRRALAQLTDEQREVIMYKYVLGYDNERTARLVGKNINAVNQLHHRALASLYRLLRRTEDNK